jgi:GNAT superfamily N-acetyltransferase
MSEYTIRTMEVGELKRFYQHIKQDFPAGEYPPYEILDRQLRQGLQDGLVYCVGQQDLAYSICAGSSDYVLLSLMAVLPEFRGKGVGSGLLQALQHRYSHKQAIIGEVDRPVLAAEYAEHKLRSERIEFYERAGYYLIPDIDYTIWDVPMHLIALPLRAARNDINKSIRSIMYQIYVDLMGESFMHKMILKQLRFPKI